MLARKEVPKAAYVAAEALLSQPLTESIWFTHGLIIMAACDVLGLARSRWKRFKPQFCEVRVLPIG
ncbi:MAG TPA: hypothetical protein VLI05_03250 [Candidatus Saccharimonadia bacterium]|nr:hypothetical protein [Candidatus Saccharimonadia bacterium]